MSFGQRQERLANGQIVRRFERSTGETTLISAPTYYYNDFFNTGATVLGEGWTETETNSGTVTTPADVGGGVVRLATVANALDIVAAAQTAQRFNVGVLSASKFAQVEFRARFSATNGTAGLQGFLGLMGAFPTLSNTGVWPDADHHAGFVLGAPADPMGQSVDIHVSVDDGVTDLGPINSGADFAVVPSVPIWKTYRIDFSNLQDVKFYVDDVRVATSTTFVFNGASEAVSTMGITLGLIKHTPEGDSTVGTLDVDSVRFWSIR